ncbi:uncharacterized protein PHACADRAFT_61593, partial [Phanerochaete carnosa HHB-10118-sp]
MTDGHAKKHTNKSNRARDNVERKIVYKSVLDNPLQVRWPNIPENIQNAILALIVSILDGVAEMHAKTQSTSRKRKKGEHTAEVVKKKYRLEEQESSCAGMHVDTTSQSDTPTISADGATQPPIILDHLTIGINEVTKALEHIAKFRRRDMSSEQSDSPSVHMPTSRLVVVCLADINPPILVGHLPNLVAACNSAESSGDRHKTWLVPLAKGAEQTLAAAIGLKRVATIAIDASAPQFSSLEYLLESVPILTAPWLHPTPNARTELVPTHIKQLKTTAPKDMRAAKELRTKGRVEAKRRKQAK